MSSFDPDDTTPLITPAANANHGTFQGQQNDDDEPLDASSFQGQEQSDDEMLDARPSAAPQNQRFNPFNRVPNLPPQLADELAVTVDEPATSSFWGRFTR
jgi:hypothetical protein